MGGVRTRQINDLRTELAAVVERAEAAEIAKRSFLSNMSHELRTPLHGILSFARLGKERIESLSPEKLVQFFAQIEDSGERLLNLVNALIDLSKLESDRTEFRFEKTSLNGIIDAAVHDNRERAEENSITIATGSCEPVMAQVDVLRITQVVHQMIHNAVRYSPEGGSVVVELETEEGDFVLTVADEGPGIPETELTSIFEGFVQSSTTATQAGGTGLGLAISARIVESHRGAIWAENRDQGGAVFRIRVPIERDIPADA